MDFQKINKESEITYLQLDNKFTISIPNDGTHNDYKGYGTRTYNSYQGVPKKITNWGKIKDVYLPFDVYLIQGTTTRFIPKNTWMSDVGINIASSSHEFLLPVWVKEGQDDGNGNKYNIVVRVVAENCPTGRESDSSLMEENKNSDISKYVATKTIPVEVVGKIYDLRISSTNDPGWYNQIKGANGEYISEEELPFGQQDQHKLGNKYQNAPKLGYTVVFDVKTKGRKSNNLDISVQPQGFYFVSKNGGNAQEVDLYYHTTTEKYVQITPSDSRVPLNVKISEPFMKVSAQERVDSARIYKSEYNTVYDYTKSVNAGYFAQMKLPHSLRLCYNNFAEYVNKLYGNPKSENEISNDAGSRDTVIGSVGHWYAGYKLPASTIAVPKGTSKDNVKKLVESKNNLTDGYILVRFDLISKYNEWNYLRYTGPEGLAEGIWNKTPYVPNNANASQNVTLPNGKPANIPQGTVVIYEAGIRSNNDYEVSGTH